MNFGQFKGPPYWLCLPGSIIISWPLTQDVVGSSSSTKKNEFAAFRKNSSGKLKFMRPVPT